MADGIYTALSGAIAQSTSLETTATNLANASTDGYQRMRPIFREALAGASTDGAPLRFSTVASTSLDATPGNLRVTGRGLDVALPKGTYLGVSTDRGERYTRAGSLTVAGDGTLKTIHGQPVLNEAGQPIHCSPNGEVKISQSGQIWQNDAPIGRLRLVTFERPEQLSVEGGTLLAAAPSAGQLTPSKDPIEVGSLEESNASVVGAMTDLISASRTFEAFQRAIDAFREADRKVVTSVPST
jgi:flagellar basal-body rod protein FlgF